VERLDRSRRVFTNRVVIGRGIIGSKECQIRLKKLAVADQTVNCQNLALMANCGDCCVLLLFCGRESLAYRVPYCQAGYFREWLQLLI